MSRPRQVAEGFPSSVLSPELRNLTLGLPVVVTLFAFDNLGVTTVMPRIARDLHGLGLYGWAFSAFTLATMAGLVLAGGHADRHGPAPSLTLGLAVFVVGLLVTASALDMRVVVLGRALQGLGSGAFGTTMYVVIGRAYPAPLRPKMFAVASSAWVLPSLVGPLLAGWAADAVGWRWVFVGLALLAPAPMWLTVPRLRSMAGATQVGSAPPGGAWRGVAVAVGAGALVAGLTQGRWATLAVLAALGASGAVWGLRGTIPPGVWRAERTWPAAIGARGLFNLAFFGTDAFIPLLLVHLHRISPARAGLPLTAGALSWTAGSWFSGRLRQGVGPGLAGAGGAILCALGIGGQIVAIHSGAALAWCGAGWALAGLGMGVAYNLQAVTVVDQSPAGEEGARAAALQMTDALGVALGTGTGGAFVALAARWHERLDFALLSQFLLAATVVTLAAVVALRVGGPSREPGPVA